MEEEFKEEDNAGLNIFDNNYELETDSLSASTIISAHKILEQSPEQVKLKQEIEHLEKKG
jgi:hypothetical protein